MGHDHAHAKGHAREGSTRRLIIALLLNVGITAAQVVGGILSGSLSLLADAAHNGSDAASLGISYGARKVSQRRADRRRTFGYERAETIGAMINLTTLFVIAIYLIYSAIRRFLDPSQVEGTVMLIVGAIAFVEDAISTWLLYKDIKGSLNIRAAFIHMFADTLATVGVIVGGLLIMFYQVYWVDPAVTAAIAVYILVHGSLEIRKTVGILMESAPQDFDYDAMVKAVTGVSGVYDVHHVHVWRLDEERLAMEAHLIIGKDKLETMERIKEEVKQRLKNDFGVDHATLEITRYDVGMAGDDPARSIIPDEP